MEQPKAGQPARQQGSGLSPLFFTKSKRGVEQRAEDFAKENIGDVMGQ
jgi:hypothetical protein